MKKILSTILILSMLFSTVAMLTAFPAVAEDATDDPIDFTGYTAISDQAGLSAIKSGGKYYLTKDITLTSNWTYVTVGNFTLDGRDLNGNVHTITFSGGNYPLLSSPDDVTIKYLNLAGSIIRTTKADGARGALANTLSDCVLKNVCSSVELEFKGGGTEGCGGIVGWVTDNQDGRDTLIENCEFSGKMKTEAYIKGFGGIVGIVKNNDTTSNFTCIFRNCVNMGQFEISKDMVEGNDGWTVAGIIDNAWSNVTGGGGLLIEGCRNEPSPHGEMVIMPTSSVINNPGGKRIAGIIGIANFLGDIKVKDCVNNADYNLDHSFQCGGIVSCMEIVSYNVTIEGCTNNGDITVSKHLYGAGGMVSRLYQGTNTVIRNCTNNGDITAKSTATISNTAGGIGGIVAYLQHDVIDTGTTPGSNPIVKATIESCSNNGKLTCESGVKANDSNKFEFQVGGIIGKAWRINSLTINKCVNGADINTQTGSDTSVANDRIQGTGGIIGGIVNSLGTSYVKINNSHNNGNLDGKFVGGIFGAAFGLSLSHNILIDISYCSNTGTITALYRGKWSDNEHIGSENSLAGDAGGIVGGMDRGGDEPGGDLKLSYCFNEGNVRGGRFAGGLLGVRTPYGSNDNPKNCKSTTIDNCVNSGKIETSSGSYYAAAAGLVGSAKGTFTVTNSANTGTVSAYTGGTNGYTAVPLLALQEDKWDSVFGTKANNNANYFSANGSAAASSSGQWTQAAFINGGRINHTDNPQGFIDATAATNKVNAVVSAVLSEGETSMAGKTVYVTDFRQFKTGYDLGARKFVLLGDVRVTKSGYAIDLKDAEVDGQGHAIILQSDYTAFNKIENSIVKNLNLATADADSSVTYKTTAGGLAKVVAGTTTVIDNVNSSITLDAGGDSTDKTHMGMGGIIGVVGVDKQTTKVTIRNCTFSGSITSHAGNTYRERCVGGIIGHVIVGSKVDRIYIENCTNTGTINGTRAGGIAGGVCTNDRQSNNNDGSIDLQQAEVNFTNCANKGTLTAFAILGGIVGDTSDRSYLIAENTNKASRDALQIPMAKVTVDGCLNEGALTVNGLATNNGITGNSVSISLGGMVGAADGNLFIYNSINTGNLSNENASYTTARRNVGGMLGMKLHQSYPQTDGDVGILIENCKNTGDVAGSNMAIGGIMGYVWVGNLTIRSCVNTGHVVSTGTNSSVSTGFIAAGILGYVGTWGSGSGPRYEGNTKQIHYKDAEYKVNVEKCINAGTIEHVIPAYRDADAWKMVCGIVGGTTTGVRIADCVHTGKLVDNADWFNSGFPISNPLEFVLGLGDTTFQALVKDPTKVEGVDYIYAKRPIELCEYSGNFYAPGSVDDILTTSSHADSKTNPHYHYACTYGLDMYQFATEGTPEELKTKIQGADVYAFDRVSYLDDQIEFAKWILKDAPNYHGLTFSATQLATLNAEVASGEALMEQSDDTGYVWSRQNEVYTQEKAIREAVMASVTNSSYEIVIPEKIATNSEVKVSVKINKFSYYYGVHVSMESANGFELRDDKSNKIPYSMWYEGGKDFLMFSKDLASFDELYLMKNDMDLVYTESYTKSMMARVTSEDSAGKPEGIYKDDVTFKVEKINIEDQDKINSQREEET